MKIFSLTLKCENGHIFVAEAQLKQIPNFRRKKLGDKMKSVSCDICGTNKTVVYSHEA